MMSKSYHIYLEKSTQWLFILMAFALPLNLFLNNLLLTVFIVTFSIYKLTERTFLNLEAVKSRWGLLLLLWLPFLLPLAGMLYSENTKGGLRLLERLVPLVFTVYFIVQNRGFFAALYRPLYTALVVGSLCAAFISWGLTFYELLHGGHSLGNIFTQEYGSHNLAERIGVHTPYLALFTNASIGFSVYSLYDPKRILPKPLLVVIILLLTVFLFTLMARNGIFCFLFFAILLLVKERKYLLLLATVAIIALLSLYVFSTEENYLRDRFFNSVNIFEEETVFSKKDSRFERWEASIAVWEQFPLVGPGTASADTYRKEIYVQNLDSEAYNNAYNSHNQFLEYLSTYGSLGGIVFLLLFFVLFYLAVRANSFFVLFIVSCFFIANITESLLQRSWGVVYYCIVVLTVLAFPKNLQTESNG